MKCLVVTAHPDPDSLCHALADPAQSLEIAQGRYAGRPSTIVVRQGATGRLLVSGDVWPVAQGTSTGPSSRNGAEPRGATHVDRPGAHDRSRRPTEPEFARGFSNPLNLDQEFA